MMVTSPIKKEKMHVHKNKFMIRFDSLCLTPLSAIFQLYHGDQF